MYRTLVRVSMKQRDCIQVNEVLDGQIVDYEASKFRCHLIKEDSNNAIKMIQSAYIIDPSWMVPRD